LIPDSAGGFYLQPASIAIHYLHSFDGGAASLAETGGCLNKIRTAVIHKFAGEFDFRGIQ